MKRLLPILLAFFLLSLASRATDVSGPVSGTWTLPSSPYNVIGQINIPAGQELVIEPGVQVIFQGWYKFLIYGRLQAMGTEADSITFTAADTSHGWHGLRFYDINSQPDSSRLVYCKITYGKSSGVNSAGDDKNGGAIFCSNSGKLRIEHCLIAHNRTGNVVGATGYPGTPGPWGIPGGPGENVISGYGGSIYLTESDCIIAGSYLCDNRTGDATGGAGGEGGDHVGFTGAMGTGGGQGGLGRSGNGGAICGRYSAPILMGNILSNNLNGTGIGGMGGEGGYAYAPNSVLYGEAYGGNGGHGGSGYGGNGGALYMDSCGGLFRNNLLIDNRSGQGLGGSGAAGGWAMHMSQMGPEIPGDGGDGGNGSGGDGCALAADSAPFDFINGTISLNLVGQGSGGAGGQGPGTPGNPGLGYRGEYVVYCAYSITPALANCIIWNNVLPAISGNPAILYSCIEGGYPGVGNISSDPLFIGNPLGDYFLSQIVAGQIVQSPCVNTGHPDSAMIVGTTRTDAVQDQGIVDMGYHYPFFTAAPVLYVAPQILNFLGVIGAGNPQDQIFQISNITMGSFNFQVVENTDWLTVSPMRGGPVPPTSIETVSVNIDQLSVGNYAGDIVVLAPMAQGSPDTVHVSLFVGNAMLLLSVDSLSFAAAVGGSNPPNQNFVINNGGVGTLNYSISEGLDWLSVSPMLGGPVPPAAAETVMVDITGLPIGTYRGDIVVTTPWGLNSPDSVHVALIIGETILEVQPDSIVYYTNLGGGNPPDDSAYVMNVGFGTFQFTVAETLAWLSVSPQSGGPVPPTARLTVSVHNSLLGVGTHSGFFNVIASGVVGSPQTVIVNVHVLPALSGSLSGIIASGTYNVYGDISVQEGDSLTIEPGTTFEFQGPFSFDIMGYLCAEGSELDSIKFILDSMATNWSGLNFEASEDSCRLKYCLVSGSDMGGISCFGASPIIKNCLITDNSTDGSGGGIYCQDSHPEIVDCVISNNLAQDAGGGFGCVTSAPILERCVIDENDAFPGLGGGISCYLSTVSLQDCRITDNDASLDGSGIRCSSSAININNCTINENSTNGNGAIACLSSNLSIDHSVVCGNLAYLSGGGLFIQNSNVSIEYCAFRGNGAPSGSAICAYGLEPMTIRNSIVDANNLSAALYLNHAIGVIPMIAYNDFSNNAEGNFTGPSVPGGLGAIFATNLNGDSCDTYNNIFLDPLFLNPDSGDFHLTEDSPCIDAGDPESPLDPDSTIADMGAFYFHHLVGIAEPPERFIPESFFLEGNHPNPFNPATTITFGLPVASRVQVEVFDIAGRLVGLSGSGTAPTTGYFPAGVHEVTFDGSDLPSGIYILRLQGGDFSAINKMVLLK